MDFTRKTNEARVIYARLMLLLLPVHHNFIEFITRDNTTKPFPLDFVFFRKTFLNVQQC